MEKSSKKSKKAQKVESDEEEEVVAKTDDAPKSRAWPKADN
jgi:hypothetical protein